MSRQPLLLPNRRESVFSSLVSPQFPRRGSAFLGGPIFLLGTAHVLAGFGTFCRLGAFVGKITVSHVFSERPVSASKSARRTSGLGLLQIGVSGTWILDIFTFLRLHHVEALRQPEGIDQFSGCTATYCARASKYRPCLSHHPADCSSQQCLAALLACALGMSSPAQCN